MASGDSKLKIDDEMDALGNLDVDFQDFEDDDKGEPR
jgi:hypothetical protein